MSIINARPLRRSPTWKLCQELIPDPDPREDVYLKGYTSVGAARTGIGEWIERYNTWRPHTELGNRTPAQAYREERSEKRHAA